MAKKAKKFDLEVEFKVRTTVKVNAEDFTEAEAYDFTDDINGLPQKFEIVKLYVPITVEE